MGCHHIHKGVNERIDEIGIVDMRIQLNQRYGSAEVFFEGIDKRLVALGFPVG
jgi:hypothetical protein